MATRFFSRLHLNSTVDSVRAFKLQVHSRGFQQEFRRSLICVKYGFIARSRRVACTMADDAPAFVDLHAAARAGDLDALGARVAAGDEVDGRDKHKRTALHKPRGRDR